MRTFQLQPKDSSFSYQGETIEMKNFQKNTFSGSWTFDLYYSGGFNLGVPVSTGTNVLKGNGTPFFKFVFIDEVSVNGDLTLPSNAKLFILEE